MYQNIFQVLRGDLKPAIETHEMLYQVTKQHNFLPEVINDWLHYKSLKPKHPQSTDITA